MKFIEVKLAMREAHKRQIEELDKLMCTSCIGTGKQSDLEMGDISGNEWTCEDCNGSGYKHGRV